MCESVKSASQLKASVPSRGKRCLRYFLTGTFAISVALPFFSHTEVLWILTRSWHEVLLLIAMVLNSAFMIQRWRQAKTDNAKSGTRTEFSWSELFFWNGAGLVVIFLLIRQAIPSTVAWGLMIGLRIGIPAIWLFVIVASPFACREIIHRRRRPVSRLVKSWFSLCLLTAISESMCLLILASRTTNTTLSFPEQLRPPDNSNLHIASIGGSTTMGWPWQPHYSISKVAAWQLERKLRQTSETARRKSNDEESGVWQRRVVVHNVAQKGDALKQDILQLHRLPVKPHVLMVYSGHNELYQEIDEFSRVSDSPTPGLDRVLSWSPTFCVIDRVLTERFNALWRIRQLARRLVDDAYLTVEQKSQRLARFTDRLRQLSQFCRRQDILLIWFIPAASESACPPNRSTIRGGGRTSENANLQAAYQQARDYEQRLDWTQAAELYREQLRDYPEMAEFHFRLGHCLLHINQPQDAAASFQSALETDAFPVRAQADYRQAVEQVAREYGNVTIDTAALLGPLTPNGILDDTVILDDVHPTLRSVFVLGTEAARIIQRIVEDKSPEIESEQEGSFLESLKAFNINPIAVADAYEQLAGVLPNRAILRFEQSHWEALADRLRSAATDLRGLDSLPERTRIESYQDFHY